MGNLAANEKRLYPIDFSAEFKNLHRRTSLHFRNIANGMSLYRNVGITVIAQ
jgi:hypothetical protein